MTNLSHTTAYKKIIPINALNYPSEREEQIWLVKYLTVRKIPFYHIPNGGYRQKKMINDKWVPLEAKILKKMGVQPGVPDICIPIKTEKYGALYIELKRKNATEKNLTKFQKEWLQKLQENGNCAYVAFGWIHAMKLINEYLNMKIENITYNIDI